MMKFASKKLDTVGYVSLADIIDLFIEFRVRKL